MQRLFVVTDTIAHLSGARNDSGKLLDKSGNYKNLEVKYEDNT